MTLKRSPFPHSGFRASGKRSETAKKWKDDYYFLVKEKHRVCEWSDRDGNVVAAQSMTGGDEIEPQPEFKLAITVPLTRCLRDGLVALWYLWLWHQHAITTRKNKGWNDGKTDRVFPTLPCLS